eukprot:1181125-Pyramimonas_sp.AAC.1
MSSWKKKRSSPPFPLGRAPARGRRACACPVTGSATSAPRQHHVSVMSVPRQRHIILSRVRASGNRRVDIGVTRGVEQKAQGPGDLKECIFL